MKLSRTSGKPLNQEHIQEYEESMGSAMSVLETIYGKCAPENASKFRKELSKVRAKLIKKYPMHKNIRYPRTKADMSVLCGTYGPIAMLVENNALVAVVLDNK